MDPISSARPARWRSAALAVALTTLPGGCATLTPRPVRADRFRIEVRLEPAAHRVVGRTVLDLAFVEKIETHRPVAIELLLHPDLRIRNVDANTGASRYRGVNRRDEHRDGKPPAARHVIEIENPRDAFTLFVQYEGRLFQDVEAGEKPGEIHNFEMSAHVGEDGIYLAEGYWYPRPDPDAVDPPALSDFELLADAGEGVALVATGLRNDGIAEPFGRHAWRSPYPLPDMALIGGPLSSYSTKHAEVTIHAHLPPDQANSAAEWAAAVASVFDRYEPLLGAYPTSEFSVVSNFFSSGFAFPTFTLLSDAVIAMGRRSQQTHGYLDHEILHGWWGNGVFIDPRDGNWCEALATYAANYYGHVLDGNEEEARRIRRNYVHFLSRIKPEDDKPLGTFGQDDGCSRSIGYSKGAMVFHMLARVMGQDAFWEAMRRFSTERIGQYGSWEDLRRTCESTSGRPLESFFEQWVRRGGAPMPHIDAAEYDSATQALRLTISQPAPEFEIPLPVRLHYDSTSEDKIVTLSASQETFSLAAPLMPSAVELDPDYHLFRRVPEEHILPTTARTRRGPTLISIVPDEHPETYARIADTFESDLEPRNRRRRTTAELQEGDLAATSALILGDAVRNGYVAGFLTAVEFPVRFTPQGFVFDGASYEGAGDAIMCTIGHPGTPGGGITVVFANEAANLPPASFLPMYDHSVVVFRDKRAILRKDLESRDLVPVTLAISTGQAGSR